MRMDRCRAQVASQRSPVLRNGKARKTLVFAGLPGIRQGPHRGAGTPIPRMPKTAVTSCGSAHQAIGRKRKISGLWGWGLQEPSEYAEPVCPQKAPESA